MKINTLTQLSNEPVNLPGAKAVTMSILVGPSDGSKNIIMRLFTVQPGGYTPHHQHAYEHVVKVEEGTGIVVDEFGKEHVITVEQSVYVEPDKMHQFKNLSNKPFKFICVIPNPDKNVCKL